MPPRTPRSEDKESEALQADSPLADAVTARSLQADDGAREDGAGEALGVYKGQRTPSQARSRRRFEAIVAAAEELLKTANIEDLSFYDIARQAEIPPPSVFYLFPTRGALQMELRRRHNLRLCTRMVGFHDQLARKRVLTWQEWMRIEAGEARAYYDANRQASEALLGPLLDRKNRKATLDGNAMTGASTLANMRRVFEVPDMPGLEKRFGYSCELLELFWGASYMANGRIDDQAFEQSLAASIGYLRNFLPETLPMRRPDLADG